MLTRKTISGFALLVGLAQASPAIKADTSWSWNDGLNLEFSEDATLSIGGLIQADAVQFNEDLTALEDNEDFRRARVVSRLSIGDFRMAADYDFGVSEGWKIASVQYRGLPRKRFTFGNHSAPFSIEDLSSSRHQPFLERSIASALSPGLLLGASYRSWGENWSATAGVFADELNDKQRRDLPGNSLNARLTYSPLNSDTTTVHLGVAGEVREIDSGENVRHRARAGTRLSDTRLIDTGTIAGVDRSDTAGLELAAAYRGIRLQAAAAQARLNRSPVDLHFSSHSVMISTVIGASDYRYSRSRGVFNATEPEGRFGAVELAARYAELDLTDGTVTGGLQSEATFGASWILNEQTRATVNYTDITTEPNRDGANEDLSLWSVRLQVEM